VHEPTEIDGGVRQGGINRRVQISAFHCVHPGMPKFTACAAAIDSCVSISASFFFSPISFLDEQKENRHTAERCSLKESTTPEQIGVNQQSLTTKGDRYEHTHLPFQLKLANEVQLTSLLE
jgi:hypothetical protein